MVLGQNKDKDVKVEIFANVLVSWISQIGLYSIRCDPGTKKDKGC
jgi:hypothetical protein